jgi:hypothetical protein
VLTAQVRRRSSLPKETTMNKLVTLAIAAMMLLISFAALAQDVAPEGAMNPMPDTVTQ